MLHTLDDVIDCTIKARDGPVGRVKDCYFDDEAWFIRYLVVDIHTWLSGRKVLISTPAIENLNWEEHLVSVRLTKQQVEGGPDIDTERPVSRQHERTLLEHYDYPCYWNGSSPVESVAALSDDHHLRSCVGVTKYHIQATDGHIGHVAGVLFDEGTWAIRYLIANTSDWWLGHQVLIAPQWIEKVSWDDRTVAVRLTQSSIKNAPPYLAQTQFDRNEEMKLHNHYRVLGFWADEAMLQNAESRAIAGRSSRSMPATMLRPF